MSKEPGLIYVPILHTRIETREIVGSLRGVAGDRGCLLYTSDAADE